MTNQELTIISILVPIVEYRTILRTYGGRHAMDYFNSLETIDQKAITTFLSIERIEADLLAEIFKIINENKI